MRKLAAVIAAIGLAGPAMAQRSTPLDPAVQLDVNHAIAPFQEQRNAAFDAAAFCSINLDQAQAKLKFDSEQAQTLMRQLLAERDKLKVEIEELKKAKPE